MLKGVIVVAALAAATGFGATMGATPALADQPGECVSSSSGPNPGPIRTGPTPDSPVRGYCTPGDDTIVRCYSVDKQAVGTWFLINDPAPTGARGYINLAWYKTYIPGLRPCAQGEQWG